MNYKIAISALLTCLAIAAPLCLISLQSETYTLVWDKLLYHTVLLLSVAVIYWSVGLMHYMELKKCNAQSAVEQFSVLVYPMTFLVVLSIVLLGVFSLSDDYVREHQPALNSPASLIPWARFGVSTIEVFPGVFFPVGVVMYAFWGAFLYNLYNFIRRIIDGDFVPRVMIMGGIRIVLAIFASLLIYFLFFREGSQSSTESLIPSGLLIVTSFLAGFYPRQTLKMVITWMAGRLSQMFPAIGKYIYTPLTVIQGITLEIEDRLNEEGIDSIQALATADVSKLLGCLPYPDNTILDWIDQAKLAVYFVDEAEFASLAGLGIRTYSSLLVYREAARARPALLDEVDPRPLSKERFKHFILHGVFPEAATRPSRSPTPPAEVPSHT
jgi:hypothetical protein